MMIRLVVSFFIYLATSMIWGMVSSKEAYAREVTLRDKIGQMFIVGFDGASIDEKSPIVREIEANNLGGVILFDYNHKTKSFGKNITSHDQLMALTQRLQEFNHSSQLHHGRKALPLWISIDYEGGLVDRLKSKEGFSDTLSAQAVAKLPVSEAKMYASEMAKNLKEAGFNLNFAPVLDVNVNPENPILGKKERTYSDDPYIVAQYAGLFAEAYLNQGVQCAFKHFPGHGSSTTDSHLGFVDVSLTWKWYELEPYMTLLNQANSCGLIMTAHIVNRQLDNTGLPATLSQQIITDLLRNTLHFEGVVVSDDMQMRAIAAHYSLEEAIVLAINAGVDVLIFGDQLDETPKVTTLVDLVEKKVESGEISMKRIDEAYDRIVRLKATLH